MYMYIIDDGSIDSECLKLMCARRERQRERDRDREAIARTGINNKCHIKSSKVPYDEREAKAKRMKKYHFLGYSLYIINYDDRETKQLSTRLESQ